jgi:hypothetical protein
MAEMFTIFAVRPMNGDSRFAAAVRRPERGSKED